MQGTRRALLAAWLFVLALLVGCANTAVKRTEAGLELDLSAKANEGYAVLRVVALRPISLLNPKWQSVHVTSNGVRAELADVTAATNAFFFGKYFPTESLYFAKLTAGQYDVSGFGSVGPGPGLLLALLASDQASATAKVPSFSVEAGKLANLGTIVFAPELKGELPEQLFLLNGPMGKQYAVNALQAETKRTDVPLAEGGGWAEQGAADGELKLLAQARQLASMAYIRATGNTVMAGTHLGQILHRAGTGRLERESIPTLGTIFSATRTAAGQWVAGGEHGTYYVKKASGEWQKHTLPQGTGRVVYAEPRGPGGVLLVSTEMRQSRFWVLDNVADAAGLAKDALKLPIMPDALLSTQDAWILPGNIPGISRETEITRVQKVDFATAKQTEKFWVMDWQVMPAGEIMMTRQNGMSPYPSKSMDGGKTWDHGQKSGGISTYWLDAKRAYSIDWKTGFNFVDNQLLKSGDGGQTWEPMGAPLATRDFAGRIVFADATEVLLQGGNMLYSTRDEGKTWVRVLPVGKGK